MNRSIFQSGLQNKIGPNNRHYTHFYIECNYIMGLNSEQIEIIKGLSNRIAIGNRYKIKVSPIYSLGFDGSISQTSYNLRQNTEKIFPDNIIHETEIIRFNDIELEFFNRINFRLRGNYLGEYFDIGFYGSWIFSSSQIIKENLEKNVFNFSRSVLKNKDLSYINSFQYGLKARFGVNRYIISFRYSLSKLTDWDINLRLPPFSIGVQIGLHK